MMKSNEEFIAGIYEKAATYTEEKETKIVKVNWVARATRIAAMAAVCIGLAGVGALVLGGNNSQNSTGIPEQTGEDYGIALTSELGEESGEAANGAAQFRIGPVAETATFTGVVESVDVSENYIWLTLIFDETAPAYTEGSVVCIKWDMLEPISEEVVVGATLTVTGSLSKYEKEASRYHGCAMIVLTDLENIEIK